MSHTNSGVAIGPNEILHRLPHRYPFLLVDRAENFVPGESVVGIKNVSANEPFFPGHFPGNPVMPGVLIVEAVAQTGALLMSASLDADPARTAIYFMGMEQVRFRRPVLPGDTLRMPVEVKFARRGIFKFHGKAMVGDELVIEFDFAAKGGPAE
ncbi:MAG: 3-hydroxyacyl-[acyl-carrier-protein] dehydratase FabZ [Maricaulis sp.]|nr:3-hydroxyacyl-[acyl-carrier-protein] dehydratase FabZ [Maricaulis sp.]HAQ36638.1 3-hydroxyacyl-[acyl-carrier-protein] dehydratase FabZ [Alphaproteobacteria bacterium]